MSMSVCISVSGPKPWRWQFFRKCKWIGKTPIFLLNSNFTMTFPTQSDSTFVPIKNETISGTESDDSSIRSVRFSKLAEVREMSPHEANEALMSRLSYSASIRVRRQKTNHKTARTALMFCVLVRHLKFNKYYALVKALSRLAETSSSQAHILFYPKR